MTATNTEKPDRPDTNFLEPIWEGLFSGENPSPILVVGNGSLGSAIRFALDRMQIPSIGIDPDQWEERNHANSFAGKTGSDKAEYVGTVEAVIATESVEPTQFPLVITATDNVASRSAAFRFFRPIGGFVDVRAARESGTIVSSLSGDYMDWKLPQGQTDERDELSCAERGSMAHTMAISGLGVSRVIFMLDALVSGRIVHHDLTQFGFRSSQLSTVSVQSQCVRPERYGHNGIVLAILENLRKMGRDIAAFDQSSLSSLIFEHIEESYNFDEGGCQTLSVGDFQTSVEYDGDYFSVEQPNGGMSRLSTEMMPDISRLDMKFAFQVAEHYPPEAWPLRLFYGQPIADEGFSGWGHFRGVRDIEEQHFADVMPSNYSIKLMEEDKEAEKDAAAQRGEPFSNADDLDYAMTAEEANDILALEDQERVGS